MTEYYHCTSEAAAEAIQKKGFRSAPTNGDLEIVFLSFRDYFTEKEHIAVGSLRGTDPEASMNLAARLWKKKFGHGTVIWLAMEPASDYGEYCFRFIPPKNAIIETVFGASEYRLAWIPTRPIPSKYFSLLEE
jgi:hypothetical protein